MLIEIAKIQFIGTQEVKSFNKPCGHEPYWQFPEQISKSTGPMTVILHIHVL